TTATATVPTGATTGNVTLTTPAGTSNGILFTVPPTVVRGSLNPAANAESAPSGTPVAVPFSQNINPGTAGTIRVFSQQYRGRRTATAST
ncbi:Ig-like domain-containing protein, partial [Hymenobacter sp. UV11]